MDYKALLVAILVPALMAAAIPGDGGAGADHAAMVQALLDRSRLLEEVRFTIPTDLWTQYLLESDEFAVAAPPIAAGMIISHGRYEIAADARGAARLTATIRIHVFSPDPCRNTPLLDAAMAWESVTVDEQPATPPTVDGWVRFSPERIGEYVIIATAPIRRAAGEGGSLWTKFRIPRSVQTQAVFAAAGAWEFSVDGEAGRIIGERTTGTHGSLAVTPRDRLKLRWRRPRPKVEHPPRYQLNGDIAWNLDAGRQQVVAELDVAIIDGAADRLALRLPAAAYRVSVTGADVRQVQRRGGNVDVLLRGKIAERTRLQLRYELPAAGPNARLEPIGIADGHWASGTLAVTSTAESAEVLSDRAAGLQEISPEALSADARSRLAGPAVLAYRITSRRWSASVDIIDLGEFALRESIADLAHYEILLRGGGSILCRTTYEVRNRTRQFVEIRLPAGSTPLLATVDEKPAAMAPTAEPNVFRLPLVRSTASVKGLISFPIEVVTFGRVDALAGEGTAALPLPRIDLPIAYAWCEAYVPDGITVRKVTGPLRRVDRYSSETATAHLGYGRGYSAGEPAETTSAAPVLATPPVSSLSLGRNYYRAGEDLYAAGKYNEAAEALRRVKEFAPQTSEAANAARLLSNIDVAQGRLEARGRASKAAAAQVKRAVKRQNEPLEAAKQRLAERGLQAAREGRRDQAEALLAGARVMDKKLAARGGEDAPESLALKALEIELDATRPAGPSTQRAAMGMGATAFGASAGYGGMGGGGAYGGGAGGRQPAAQVQMGEAITEQRATAAADESGGVDKAYVSDLEGRTDARIQDRRHVAFYVPQARRPSAAPPAQPTPRIDKRLEEFIDRNYAWQAAASRSGAVEITEDAKARLADALRRNLGQKVSVASVNFDLDADAATKIGVRFTRGRNDVRYAEIDEAQFRTLQQSGARAGGGDVRRQDAIVGAEAQLANAWTARLEYAADESNAWVVNDNRVDLAHNKYLLIDNDGRLTAMRAGRMQHWTDTTVGVELAEAPQSLQIPRVGRQIRLEKTLVSRTDELVLHIHYTAKGLQP